MNLTHGILRTYIALARGEHFTGMTDQIAEASIEFEMAIYSTRNWFVDKRLTDAIERTRGLNADEQFEKGIISVPSPRRNFFYCRKLIAVFGLEQVAAQPFFGPDGILNTGCRRYDFIFPVRKNGLIERFSFYTIREMEQWQKRAA